jgi:N-methylhydantoinase B
MSIDKARLQVLANHCAAAAESMGYTVMRTAHSTFVKETEDFSCQLMTPAGLTFASPRTMGATWYTGLDYGPLIAMFDDYREGDIYCTNDPYSGFVATHSPDMHLWRPVFSQGELVCFVGNHIHNTDVGGAVPASLSRTLTEVYQEGIRIPPMLLMRDGTLNEDLLRILEINVRAPVQNRGDLNAQLACMAIGERKVHDLIARFGHDGFKAGSRQLLDYAEEQARALIAAIPDGDYPFDEFADEDSAGGYPCRIAITMRVRGSELVLDFTGSDPQLVASINVPTGGNPRHAVIMVGVIYAFHTLDPSALLNYGTVRPVRAILPEGTVVNPQAPAAVGMRSLLGAVLQAATFGCFSQALPDRMPACPSGGSSLLNVRTATRGGRMIVASIGPVGGGGGGDPQGDGLEGCGANSAFLKNTPVEINEVEVPIEVIRYGLVPDTGGAGCMRGGCAATMEFRLLTPQSVVTARNRNRTDLAAWGVLGGQAGANSRFVRNPDGNAVQELRNQDVVLCDPGDVIRVQGPGGGGYGDPFQRPVARVLNDVSRGFVGLASARRDYGVAIGADGAVDQHETDRLRAARPATPGAHFHYGPGRSRFLGVWTPARYAALTGILAALPVSWRFFVKHQIFAALGDAPAPPDGGAADVERAYGELAARFQDLPARAVLAA